MTSCSFTGCGRKSVTKDRLCDPHYRQRKRGNRLTEVVPHGPLKIRANPVLPGTVLVPLSRGLFAVIDARDADAVGKARWSAGHRDGTTYANTKVPIGGGRYRFLTLHRFLWELWGFAPTSEIDHRNGDGIDCRRDNLRAATHRQNGQNRGGLRKGHSSGIKGVYYEKRRARWIARITVDGKTRGLGWFSSPQIAGEAYALAAREAFGEFARAV